MTRPEARDPKATRIESLQGLRVLARLCEAQKQHPWVRMDEAMHGLSRLQSETLLKGLVVKGWVAISNNEELALIRNPESLALWDVLFDGPWARPDAQTFLEETAMYDWEASLAARLKTHEQQEQAAFGSSVQALFQKAE